MDVLTWGLMPRSSILTTVATAVMRSVHDRMPVILEPADWPT